MTKNRKPVKKMPKNRKTWILAKTVVNKEIIEIESDTDEVDDKMLALCGEVNASGDDSLAKGGKTNRNDLQIVCADDCDSGLNDLEYKRYLADFSEAHFSEIRNQYLLDDNVIDTSPLRIVYNVDDEASDRSKGKAVKIQKRRGRKAKSPNVSSVSKRLKIENGRADHRSHSRTVLRTNETQQKKGDARRGRKSYVAKSSIELKPTSNVRGYQEKNRDVKHGRKNYLAKKDVKLNHTRNDKSLTIFRASKRIKTEIGREEKRVALREEKIPMTKHNNELKSSGHVEDKLVHSLKPRKKENEESLMDKNYSYYCAYIENYIPNSKCNRQVKPVKDMVCLPDPDIIKISDQPFQHRGESPFEANKDGKVHDLEDGIVPDDIFNSSFSKKLMERLRNPYDEKEFLRLYNDVSHKRPSTRCRELRDGREIEYNVTHKLALSYLETNPDFDKKYRRCRKDPPRALNLLRGFFFYYEHITLEGAFKPWMHETRLANLCANAKECKDIIVANKSKRQRRRTAL